ncbi:molybdopterin-guanine dinucleotide biosynthesis protein B [Virgibacillus kimchii]
MQGEHPFSICQIVGYKNTGKTAVMEKLIRYFTAMNKQTATLKHHGHGGEPKKVKGTDSYRHLQAGAQISAVQGENQLQLTVADTSDYTLDELLSLYAFMPIDILLLEGFKQAGFPKIIIIKNEEDLALLKLSHIMAVISWDENIPLPADKKIFLMNELDEKLPEISAFILGMEGK